MGELHYLFPESSPRYLETRIADLELEIRQREHELRLLITERDFLKHRARKFGYTAIAGEVTTEGGEDE